MELRPLAFLHSGMERISFDVSEETLSKMKNVDPENFYQVDSLYQYKDIVNMSVDTGKIRTICPHCGR